MTTGKEVLASGFARKIAHANLPIDPEDAYLFAKDIADLNPPAKWLDKVADSAFYVTREKFEADINKQARDVIGFLGRQSYAVVLNNKYKSDYWIYQQLLERGLHPAETSYTTEKELAEYEMGKYKRAEWVDEVSQTMKVCAFDDFTLGGGVIQELFQRGVPGFSSKNLYAFVSYATPYARAWLKSFNIEVNQSSDTVKSLVTNLTKRETDFLDRISGYQGMYESDGDGLSSALFWTWYKLPDNVDPLFTGLTGLHPLIREENFQPHYKN